MSLLKRILRRALSHVFVGGGVTAGGRRLCPKRGALILYGHRVSGDDDGYLQGLRPEWLDEQLAYLTRHFDVIPLSRLVRCYEERSPVPERSVVITFDEVTSADTTYAVFELVGPELPLNFQLGTDPAIYYNLTSGVVFDSLEICIAYIGGA